MFRDILIIFDNQKTCSEALAYGREFASRMDARVTLLMLVPIANIVLPFYIAFAQWPALKGTEG